MRDSGLGRSMDSLFIENSIPGEVVRVKTMKIEKVMATRVWRNGWK